MNKKPVLLYILVIYILFHTIHTSQDFLTLLPCTSALALGYIVSAPLQKLPARDINAALIKTIFLSITALGVLFVLFMSAKGFIDKVWDGIAILFFLSICITLTTHTPPKDEQKHDDNKKRLRLPELNRSIPIEQ